MSSSNQIRQSLMRIKQSQAELLRELRSQHSNLQDYLYIAEQYKPSSVTNNPQDILHLNESSLELSKSEGNLPYHRSFEYKASTTTGAEDILENNYKKIQELLIKQRKLYEENHALQEENQSLTDDYRQIKKMFYQLKQSNKDNVILLNFLLNEIVYNSFRDLLIEVPNSQITTRTAKSWNKFKIQHPKLFLPTASTEQFCQEAQKYLEKVYSLLQQDFKLNTIKTKEEEIVELKDKINYLINMNSEVKKNKEEMFEAQEQRIVSLERENYKLMDNVRKLQKQLAEMQQNGINRFKSLEGEIITRHRQIQKLSTLIKEKEQGAERLRQKNHKMKQQFQAAEKSSQQVNKELQITKQKLKQKDSLFQNQIQLSRRQNTLIDKLTQDIAFCQSQLQTVPQKSAQNQSNLLSANQNLNRQLSTVRHQYARYRQNAQKQIASLIAHTKQLKNQLQMLIKSEQNARQSQLRYKEMIAVKGNMAKLTANVDHLWAVKEIEYGNVMGILETTKRQ